MMLGGDVAAVDVSETVAPQLVIREYYLDDGSMVRQQFKKTEITVEKMLEMAQLLPGMRSLVYVLGALATAWGEKEQSVMFDTVWPTLKLCYWVKKLQSGFGLWAFFAYIRRCGVRGSDGKVVYPPWIQEKRPWQQGYGCIPWNSEGCTRHHELTHQDSHHHCICCGSRDHGLGATSLFGRIDGSDNVCPHFMELRAQFGRLVIAYGIDDVKQFESMLFPSSVVGPCSGVFFYETVRTEKIAAVAKESVVSD